MRVAIDSNILIYATDTLRDPRQGRAADVMDRALLAGAIIPVQVIGEFLNVIRRKHPERFVESIGIAESWQSVGYTVATTKNDMIAAARLVQRHRFQFWDAVIWSVAANAGARWFLSEDLQDGLSLDGMTVLNPLLPANAARLDALLPALP